MGENQKTINLALQGGGAHGAFAWGVLDKLCEDGRVEVDALSATSAGAMNATVYSYGKMMGGLEGAREALHDFWHDISKAGSQYSSSAKPAHLQQLFGGMEAFNESMSFVMFENFTKMFSPYEFNPLNLNPLKDVLLKHVDFEKISACECTKMFICATNVRTNKIKIFQNEEITSDAVLASACLPSLFQTVEIEGEAYWDGGYMGNPPLYPLIYDTDTDDILIIHINPIERDEIPKNSRDIFNRVNEVSFNSSLLREMRTLKLMKQIVDDGWIDPVKEADFPFTGVKIHSIRADEVTKEYSIASKFSSDWEFLCKLRDQGREVTEEWLKKNFDKVGVESTVDLDVDFAD